MLPGCGCIHIRQKEHTRVPCQVFYGYSRVVFIVVNDLQIQNVAVGIDRKLRYRAVAAVRLYCGCKNRVPGRFPSQHERRIPAQIEFRVIGADSCEQYFIGIIGRGCQRVELAIAHP